MAVAASDDPTPEQIAAAIRVGWTMALLRTDRPSVGKTREPQPKSPLREHLPSASETSGSEQLRILFGQVFHDLRLIAADDIAQNLTQYTPPDTQGKPDSDPEDFEKGPADLDKDLENAFVDLHVKLAGDNPRLDTALSLGHVLADTVFLPQRDNLEQIRHSFGQWRLNNVHEWLDDLHSHLPVGAADAVSGSLSNWEQYVAEELKKPEVLDHQFVAALHRQGKLWLQLLCGDKLVADQLRPENYTRAGARLAAKLARTTGDYLEEWWWLVLSLGLLALMGTIVTALLLPTDQKLGGVLIALLGTVGLSWKTVGASLGRIFSAVEKPLWEAEKKEAATEACTLHAPHRSARQHPAAEVGAIPGTGT